jgi:aspartate/methionine/tyrosine aminotransferase
VQVVIFDPMYDSYVGMCKRSGGVLKPVRLQLPHFSINPDELAAAFSPRTKFILINTPHNPTGKVFSLPELTLIAGLCIKHNTYALCDEVYEHLVFSGAKHVSLRSLPGMHDRCIRLGSAGKTFSFTAWKVRYVHI